jgi:hypothetical protein
MAYIHVALHLEKMIPPTVRVTTGRTYISKMTGNVYFTAPNPLPNPTLLFYGGICTDLETAITGSRMGKLSTEVLHNAIDDFDFNTIFLAIYVETVANAPGNTEAKAREIILSAGMVPSITGNINTVMPKPEAFKAKYGPNAGEILLAMRAIHGTKSLLCQISLDGLTWLAFQPVIFPNTKGMMIPGLTSGTNYYFRIRAIGSRTLSPWSDVIKQMAP